MTGLHETPIAQSVKIVGYTSSLFASSLMLIAGIMKVIGAEQMQLKMARVTHFEDKILIIGILELLIVVLYWIPRTMNIGFFLLASYGGGFIVAEIVAGEMPVLGITVTTLFYAGTLLRRPSLWGFLKKS